MGAADGPVKTAIFSGNTARLYGLQKQAELTRHDRFAALKAEYLANGGARSNLRYGYAARAGLSLAGGCLMGKGAALLFCRRDCFASLAMAFIVVIARSAATKQSR